IGAALAPLDPTNPNEFRRRTVGRSERQDLNKTFQVDLVGADVHTGFLKHTFQVGFDWKESDVTTTAYTAKKPNGSTISSNSNANAVDVINVYEDISNVLPYEITYIAGKPAQVITPTIGLMAQDVITFNKYLKAHLGIRYSKLNGSDKETNY